MKMKVEKNIKDRKIDKLKTKENLTDFNTKYKKAMKNTRIYKYKIG